VVPITAATMAFLPVGSPHQSSDALRNAETLSIGAASHALSLAVLQVVPEVYVVDEEDKRVLSVVLKQKASTINVLNVSLLLPIGCNFASPTESLHKQSVRQLVRLGGALSVCAVVFVDALLGEVLTAVRADATGTLAARSALLQELDDENEDPLQGSPTFAARPLPARVLVTPENLAGLPFCDYIFQDETIDNDVVPRISEMLSWSKEVQSRYVHAQVEEFCKFESRSSLPCPVVADAVGVANDSPQPPEGNRLNPSSSSIRLACGISMAFIVAAVSVAYQLAYPAHAS
jgi:Odorant response abnormal 4-like